MGKPDTPQGDNAKKELAEPLLDRRPLEQGAGKAQALDKGLDESEAKINQSMLDGYVEQYKLTDNPMFLWAAWHEARVEGLDVPEAVNDYLDEVAIRLVRAALDEKNRPRAAGPALKIALEFDKPSAGQRSCFSQFARTLDDWDTALDAAVRWRIGVDGKKMSQDEALSVTADDYGVEGQAVKRALRRQRRPPNP